MSSPSTSRSLEGLARAFLQLAALECGSEPVYDALCRAAADDPDTLGLLGHAPRTQQRPNLLLAAVHDLILRGTSHPLREYFPSAGGARPVDRELVVHFAAFRDAHLPELIERIAHRTTQTNEIGRCAVLWPALQHIARRHGRNQLALLDFGCSAGLNLGVDRYRYAYGDRALGAEASPRTPTIACRLIGDRALPSPVSPPLQLVMRQGLDMAPVDLQDDDAVRWLRACLWPHDLERAQRFDRAVTLARLRAWPVRREADCIAALVLWLRGVPLGVLPVIWNSWVLAYFDANEAARYLKTLEALVQEHSAVWLSAEPPALQLYPSAAPAPQEAGPEYAAGTLWTMCSADAGRSRYETLARAHPHGKWLEWLAMD